MSRKRKYNLATILILGVMFFGWTTFLEFSGTPETVNASGEEIIDETVGSTVSSNTPAAAADDTPAAVKTADNTGNAASAETPANETSDAPADMDSDSSVNTDSDFAEAAGSDSTEGDVSDSSEDVNADPSEGADSEDSSEPTATPVPTPEEKPYELRSFAVAKVTDFVNIRDVASSSGNLIGKLYKNGFGYMLEKGETFSKIESGPVTGYISNSYLYTGSAALQLLKENGAFKIKITGTEVNVRAAASSEADVLKTATNGTCFVFYPEESTNLWYAVKLEDGGRGYISSSVCEEFMDFGVAEAVTE